MNALRRPRPEFFQWNIDLIGASSTDTDAELIAGVRSFFQQIGLTPVRWAFS